MNAPPRSLPPRSPAPHRSRKAEALAFIEAQLACPPVAAPRREEALAIIIERIARSGTSPSYEEIGRAMKPCVSKTRARQLVDQLVAEGVLDRDPGAQRGLRVRDLVRCRAMIEAALSQGGWWHAPPLGSLTPPIPCTSGPCTNEQLPVMPEFEHIPDVE